MNFVPLGSKELYCSYYRKKVKRDYSCDTVSKNKLTCLYCNRSSEIITGRKEEMIKLGFGKKEIDKDGNEIVILIK